MELNKITNLINYIDSEMTRIYNKISELGHLIEASTSTGDERFAATLNNRRGIYMREYNLLSIEFGKLVENRRKILDLKVCEELTMLTPTERDILDREGKIQL